jgi:ATP-dependent DNA ligase
MESICGPCRSIGSRAEGWVALTNGVGGDGRALYRAVVDVDLEGIVAMRLADAYHPKLARWHKVLNRGYSQRRWRAEWHDCLLLAVSLKLVRPGTWRGFRRFASGRPQRRLAASCCCG